VKVGGFLLAAALCWLGSADLALARDIPHIPREVLFGNPERASPQISPDGKKLAYLAPDKKNVLQVWVRTVGKKDDKQVTHDAKRARSPLNERQFRTRGQPF
jgi:hypothetical protein